MPRKPERTALGTKILSAMDDGLAFANGEETDGELSVVEVPDVLDVEALRHALGMTREEFADAYGFTYKALENYESQRREVKGQVGYYLRAIQNDPIGVFNAIHGTHVAN